ncbi:MAG: hypothetical protein IT365_16865 [Candidatus Hydrogenedentes bacterium]|nr:hypothetical protein [Candidatus Hydrogenedentota bacterium]
MKIEGRDKKALTYGGAAVLAILIVGYGVIPMVRSWSSSGSSRTSDEAYVESLRESVRSQEATLEQRNALVLHMGSLFGPLAAPKAQDEKKPPETPPSAAGGPPPQAAGAPQEAPKPSPDGKPAPEAAATPKAEGADKPAPPKAVKAEPDKPEPGKPEPPKEGAPKDEAPKPEGPKEQAPKAAAPGSNTLAGYVEQNAKKAGATIKRITPKKDAAAFRNPKRFHPVTLQVSLECSIQNLVEMLKALEKGERFVKVDQLQLKRDLAGGDKIEVTMDLHSYEAVAS